MPSWRGGLPFRYMVALVVPQACSRVCVCAQHIRCCCLLVVQGIFTYVETLLPLSYIHTIMFIVKMNVLLLAVQAGLVSSKAYAASQYDKIFVQCFILLFIPGIYQGLLSMENDLRNPFGADEVDFPRAAYRTGTFKRHQEYHEGASNLPFHDKNCMPDAPKPNGFWFNRDHKTVDSNEDGSDFVTTSAVAMHEQQITSLENENRELRTRILQITAQRASTMHRAASLFKGLPKAPAFKKQSY